MEGAGLVLDALGRVRAPSSCRSAPVSPIVAQHRQRVSQEHPTARARPASAALSALGLHAAEGSIQITLRRDASRALAFV